MEQLDGGMGDEAATAGEKSGGGTATKCAVCRNRDASYVCPRCSVQYCSLQCYRDHSAGCVDAFYRDNVTEELQSTKVSDEDRKEMMTILKRVHDTDVEENLEPGGQYADEVSDDDDGKILSDATIALLSEKLEEGSSIVDLSSISDQEARAFEQAAMSGQLSHLVKVKPPWWRTQEASQIRCSSGGSTLVTELAAETTESHEQIRGVEDDDGDHVSSIPALPRDKIVPLSKITQNQPSAHLPWHLVDMLFAYCYTWVVYNGETKDSSDPAALELFKVSNVLMAAKEKKDSSSFPTTLEQCLQNCLESGRDWYNLEHGGGGSSFCVGTVGEVAILLDCGKPAVLCAIEDIRSMTHFAAKSVTPGTQKSLKGIERKLGYFLSWANEQAGGFFQELSGLVKCAYECQRDLVPSASKEGRSKDGIRLPDAQ
mmetsp:Transcript_10137/g.25712  ORF Transcript_10137/g.25712 Transcript_10137/m.25712 type:complete len:428 (-) Transcript_10137:144-1427(-)